MSDRVAAALARLHQLGATVDASERNGAYYAVTVSVPGRSGGRQSYRSWARDPDLETAQARAYERAARVIGALR